MLHLRKFVLVAASSFASVSVLRISCRTPREDDLKVGPRNTASASAKWMLCCALCVNMMECALMFDRCWCVTGPAREERLQMQHPKLSKRYRGARVALIPPPDNADEISIL